MTAVCPSGVVSPRVVAAGASRRAGSSLRFQIAPTSVFGLSGRYGLGRRGELNFVGLYQSEKTIMSRPQLGVEPQVDAEGAVGERAQLADARAELLGLEVEAREHSQTASARDLGAVWPGRARDC